MQKKLWNKDFILMLQGNIVSNLGDILYSVAIGYWVYEATGSSALMGLMSSISMFMTMIVMPFSGSIIDKCDRKLVIVGMDALRGIVMLVMGVLAFTSNLSVPVVLVSAFLASACDVFFDPAVSTLMIDIIPHDDMVRGKSVFSGSNTFLQLVGSALSGVLVAFLGVPLIITLNGVSYLISALTELFIHVPKTKRQGEAITVSGVFQDFGSAIKAIIADPFMRVCVPCMLSINFLASGSGALMLPFLLDKGFTVDTYGFFMAVETAAALVCVALLGIVKLNPRLRYALLAGGLLSGLTCSIGFYLSGNALFMGVMLFLAAFGMTLGNSIFHAAFALALPEENRGGIIGLFSSSAMGGVALASVVNGLLCEVFPYYLVFTVGTLLSLIPTALFTLSKSTRDFILKH